MSIYIPLTNECGVCGDQTIIILAWGECGHAVCGSCAAEEIGRKLTTGQFPPVCSRCQFDGMVTPIAYDIIDILVTSGDLTQHVASRFDRQVELCDPDHYSSDDDNNIIAVVDEESVALIYATSKDCPECGVAITHFRNHGCHHIMPGGGCPKCGHNFCYHCLETWIDHDNCSGGLFCNDQCDCPECPECKPGSRCDFCDGCPACEIKSSDSSEW